MSKNVRDIRRHVLGVPDAIDLNEIRARNGAGNGEEENPLDRALRARETLAAQGVIRSTTAEVDAEARSAAREAEVRAERAELELEETRARLEELREARRNRSAGPSRDEQLLAVVLNTMQEQNKDLREQLAALQNQNLQILQGEIGALRQQAIDRAANGQGEPRPGSFMDQLAEFERFREATKRIFGELAAPAALTAEDVDRDLDRVRAINRENEEHERRRREMERADKRWEAEFELRKSTVEEDSRRGRAMTGWVSQALPAIERIAEEVVTKALAGRGAPPGGAAPAIQQDGPPYPEGTRQGYCPGCQTLVPFPPGHERATCTNPTCRTELVLRDTPPPEEPQPARETSSIV